jgi:hypothetical protein
MKKMKKIVLFTASLLAAAAAFAQDAPLWLTRRGAVYPSDRYVTGVGEGRAAEDARIRALAQIAQFFSTKVADTRGLFYSYNEALSGAAAENTAVFQNTAVHSEAEFFGVEFAETFTDNRGIVHALALIDRAEAGRVYEARIQANARLIGDLIIRYENSPHPKEAVKRLKEARRFARIIIDYAGMAMLLDSSTARRYDQLPAVASRIDGMIAANEKRFTATVSLNDGDAESLARKTAEILMRSGFLVVDSGGVYTASITFRANESSTKNYRTLEPTLDIVITARDGTPLLTYTRKYPLFRHVTREEALARALRNIEQDLTGEFAREVGRIGE